MHLNSNSEQIHFVFLFKFPAKSQFLLYDVKMGDVYYQSRQATTSFTTNSIKAAQQSAREMRNIVQAIFIASSIHRLHTGRTYRPAEALQDVEGGVLKVHHIAGYDVRMRSMKNVGERPHSKST
jgi:hypothetical protein